MLFVARLGYIFVSKFVFNVQSFSKVNLTFFCFLEGLDLDDFDSCIFTEVLLPRRSSASAREENKDSLQFEVHYRDTTKKTLLTFLFNHSRIMLIIDYLLDTYNFIMCRMFKPSAGLLRALLVIL